MKDKKEKYVEDTKQLDHQKGEYTYGRHERWSKEGKGEMCKT